MNGHLNIVKYLAVKKQCDPTSRNTFSNTSLHAVAKKGHVEVTKFLISELNCVMQTLLDSVVDCLFTLLLPGMLTLVKYLVKKLKCNPQALDNFDYTPIMGAVYSSLPCVQYFVEITNSHALKAKTISDESILHFAACDGLTEVISYLSYGFSPDTPGWMNRTTIHYVAEYPSNIELLKHLITNFTVSLKLLMTMATHLFVVLQHRDDLKM